MVIQSADLPLCLKKVTIVTDEGEQRATEAGSRTAWFLSRARGEPVADAEALNEEPK